MQKKENTTDTLKERENQEEKKVVRFAGEGMANWTTLAKKDIWDLKKKEKCYKKG